MSTRRIILHKKVAGEFADKLVRRVAALKVGDPTDPETVIGPIITPAQLKTITRNVANAVADGARILTGGEATGPCFQPTIVGDVKPGTPFASEVTFGPVVALMEVEDVEEVINVANDTDYGLSASVFSRDFAKAWQIAERLETGMVHINDQTVNDEPQVEFGGVKDSGWGRFGGSAAVEEFTELRWISVQLTPRKFPF